MHEVEKLRIRLAAEDPRLAYRWERSARLLPIVWNAPEENSLRGIVDASPLGCSTLAIEVERSGDSISVRMPNLPAEWLLSGLQTRTFDAARYEPVTLELTTLPGETRGTGGPAFERLAAAGLDSEDEAWGPLLRFPAWRATSTLLAAEARLLTKPDSDLADHDEGRPVSREKVHVTVYTPLAAEPLVVVAEPDDGQPAQVLVLQPPATDAPDWVQAHFQCHSAKCVSADVFFDHRHGFPRNVTLRSPEEKDVHGGRLTAESKALLSGLCTRITPVTGVSGAASIRDLLTQLGSPTHVRLLPLPPPASATKNGKRIALDNKLPKLDLEKEARLLAAIEDHGEKLLSTAWARLCNYHDAESAVQEVFIDLQKALASVNIEIGHLRGWLFHVLRCRVERVHRDRQRRGISQPLESIPELAVDSHSSTSFAQDPKLQQKLRHYMQTLPEKQRTCIELRYWGECSLAETAHEMKQSVTNVKTLGHRGEDRLREKFADAPRNDFDEAECLRESLAKKAAQKAAKRVDAEPRKVRGK